MLTGNEIYNNLCPQNLSYLKGILAVILPFHPCMFQVPLFPWHCQKIFFFHVFPVIHLFLNFQPHFRKKSKPQLRLTTIQALPLVAQKEIACLHWHSSPRKSYLSFTNIYSTGARTSLSSFYRQETSTLLLRGISIKELRSNSAMRFPRPCTFYHTSWPTASVHLVFCYQISKNTFKAGSDHSTTKRHV